MRLPSQILTKLALAGLAINAACEPAHKPECKSEPVVVEEDTTPLDEVVRMTNDRPTAAPRFAKPPPPQQQQQPTRPDPQPNIKKKPKPRMVWASQCGHPALVDATALQVACGKG